MKRTTVIEISESEHGLFGLGLAVYTYIEDRGHTLSLAVNGTKAEFNGDKARRMFHKLHRDSLRVEISAAKRFACEATGINVQDLKLATRKRNVVFARAIVYAFLTEELNFSLGRACDEVGGPTNHSTVLNAVTMYNKENSELSSDEIEWKKTYINLTK